MFKSPRNKEEAIGCTTFVLIVVSILLYCASTNILTLFLIPLSFAVHAISMYYYEKTIKVIE